MDIKKYEVMLAALEKGSFARACDDLGYTQSGITNMMNSLEREVGFPLLIRSNKGVTLTDEGRRVYPIIRELVRTNERLEREYGLIREMETGVLRIGTFPSLACAWLPEAVQLFRGKYPHIKVEIIEENSIFRLQDWISSGYLEIALLSRQPTHTYEWIDLLDDPYMAVVPADSKLAQQDKIRLDDLVQHPFLMCHSNDGADQDMDRYIRSCGRQVSYDLTAVSDNMVIRLIGKGLGVSILPVLLLDEILTEEIPVAVRPLDPPVSRRLGIASKSFGHLSPASTGFVRVLTQMLQKN